MSQSIKTKWSRWDCSIDIVIVSLGKDKRYDDNNDKNINSSTTTGVPVLHQIHSQSNNEFNNSKMRNIQLIEIDKNTKL